LRDPGAAGILYPAMEKRTAVYLPSIFERTSEADARAIILTPEQGTSTEERWIKETPFVTTDLGGFLKPTQDSVLLDYGCGLGRIARELIAVHGCKIIGVDISKSMRQMAPGYVDDDRFSVVTKPMLSAMAASGLRIDGAYAIWVLQHCLNPAEDVALIQSVLKTGALFYVLNNVHAVVPSDHGWVDNGVDIIPLLDREFEVVNVAQLPVSCTTPAISRGSFIAQLKKEPAAES
jgi:SAM-dependent methyltransferase